MKSLRAAVRSALIPALLISVAGCGGMSTAPAASAPPASRGGTSRSATVIIRNFSFHPPTLTVRAGTRVTWMNEEPSATAHTATADNGAFNTESIAPGSAASFTFSTPGTYHYHCAIHNFMTGTITVVS